MDLLIIISLSILLAILFILYEAKEGKYKRISNEQNGIEKAKLEEFQKDFPEKDIDALKIEIEKISDMLLDNQESNRYTYKIQEKAKNDYKLQEFRNEIADGVEILDYADGKITAQVSYISGRIEYILIMYLDIVKKGRVFLKKYKSMKRVLD